MQRRSRFLLRFIAMHELMIGLQCLTALAVIILMAVQTEKAQQGGGGVMGLGASGGTTTCGGIDGALP